MVSSPSAICCDVVHHWISFLLQAIEHSEEGVALPSINVLTFERLVRRANHFYRKEPHSYEHFGFPLTLTVPKSSSQDAMAEATTLSIPVLFFPPK